MEYNLPYLLLLLIISTSFNSIEAKPRSPASVVARRLQGRYEDKSMKCKDKKGKEKPLYECSGILLRGINNARQLPFAWSLKPFNKQKKSYAMAYIRQDAQWPKLPLQYESGYIIYPHQKTPKRKNTYKVFCAFPLDGYTDLRAGKHACGKHKDDQKGESDHCEMQGITTFNAWKDHWKRVGPGNHFFATQCGFDMTKPSSPKLFRVFLQAMSFLKATRYGVENNEILIHAWNEKKAKNLPIEAFFYVKGSAAGEMHAREYQRSFERESGGEKVPIVSIQFPNGNIPFKVKPA